MRTGPGLFSLGAFPTFRSHDFRHGCLYVESSASEGGREGKIEVIRYRRRLKIFENFLLYQRMTLMFVFLISLVYRMHHHAIEDVAALTILSRIVVNFFFRANEQNSCMSSPIK